MRHSGYIGQDLGTLKGGSSARRVEVHVRGVEFSGGDQDALISHALISADIPKGQSIFCSFSLFFNYTSG